MLTRRLQVLVEPEQYDRLERFARDQGVSVGEAVRDAIDRVAGTDRERRQTAAERFLAMTDIDLPDNPANLDREVDELMEAE